MLYDNDNRRCSCSGPICSCGALGVVKDGAGVRVSAQMMDSSPKTSVTDQTILDRAMAVYDAALAGAGLTHDKYGRPIASLNEAEKARAVYEFEQSHAHLGDRAPKLPPAPSQSATLDRYGRPLNSLSASDRAYQEMIRHQSDAWRG